MQLQCSHETSARRPGALTGATAVVMGVCIATGMANAGTCGDPGTGDCFIAHGSPACEDAACCEAICAVDPFCCDVEWDEICADEASANPACIGMCSPACGKDNIACVIDTPQFENSRFVAMLLENGAPSCTAWIVGGPDLVMTNAHCIPADNDVSGMAVRFDYRCDECIDGELLEGATFAVTELVGLDITIDFAVLRVESDVASIYGQAIIEPVQQVEGQKIYEIHHAFGGPQGYDAGTVTGVGVNACQPLQNAVSVISAGGASGSPVFSMESHCVSAICSCGPDCGEGFVIPMSQMWPLAKPVIEAAGGRVVECGDVCGGGCDGDLDFNNTVNVSDLGLLLGHWGASSCGDLDGTGKVDAADLGSLLAAWGDCTSSCGDPFAGNCFLAHGTPYCADAGCCEAVCKQNPNCCEIVWDDLCADLAAQICRGIMCGSPGTGDCFIANGTPFCDDEACCEAVCAVDAFCCQTAWDKICASTANAICEGGMGGDCGDPDTGDCFIAHGTPFCDDEACCEAVCSIDPFCCQVEWDSQCAGEAADLCEMP